MNTRNWLTLVLCVMLASVIGCSPSGPSGSNGGGNDNGGNSNDTMATLRVTAVLQRRATAGRVVGFVNRGLVSRVDAETISWDFDASSLQTGTSQFQRGFDIGTTITLIADELYHPSTAPGATDPDAPSVPAQFVSWEGDINTDNTLPTSDKGVLFFTLNEDREIEAVFDESYLLAVRVTGGPGGTLLDYEITSVPLTIPYYTPDNASDINIVGVSVEEVQEQPMRLWGYFNNSTVITLTVPEPWPFTSWQGMGEFQGRSVTVTMAQPSNLLLSFP